MLTLPSAVALFVIAEPAIATLFQRGAFDGEAALQSAKHYRSLHLAYPHLFW